MGIYIKGMEMPKSCLICVCDIPKGNCDLWRNQTPEEHRRERHPDCPLIEVPTPHGRLIDADALRLEAYLRWFDKYINDRDVALVNFLLGKAPTIIESEG